MDDLLRERGCRPDFPQKKGGRNVRTEAFTLINPTNERVCSADSKSQ